jgi:hypothetical protein
MRAGPLRAHGMASPSPMASDIPQGGEVIAHRPQRGRVPAGDADGREGAQQRLQVPGVAPHGQVLLRPPRPRATIRPVCAPLPPDLIGMDAWARGHDRVREFSPRGHTGRRMAPPLVRPSRQHPQHEGHDAAAIGAAVSRPNRQRLPCAGSCPLFHAGAAGLEDCEQTALPGAGAKPMRLHHTRLAALSSWS